MAADPTDPVARTRADMERLRAAINAGTHWLFLTDDFSAAVTLRKSAGTDAIFVATVVCLNDRGEAFPVVALAVSKRAWPPSAAIRVAEAAAAGRGPRPDAEQVRGGADMFTISLCPERLAVVVQQLRDGALSPTQP